MTFDLNIFILGKQPSDLSNQSLDEKLIQELPSEHFEDKYIDSTNQNFR